MGGVQRFLYDRGNGLFLALGGTANAYRSKEEQIMKFSAVLIKVAVIVVLAVTVAFTTVIGFPGSATAATLSEDEVADLTFQREEEKLARDVYLTLYAKWGAVIFSNIAKSEERHTDTLKKKLDKYNLPDPALPTIGAFTNPDLQAKYDSLVADGQLSYIDGLYIGATIEEIDMIDIQQALDATTHLDCVPLIRTSWMDRRITCGPLSPGWRPKGSSTNPSSSVRSSTTPL